MRFIPNIHKILKVHIPNNFADITNVDIKVCRFKDSYQRARDFDQLFLSKYTSGERLLKEDIQEMDIISDIRLPTIDREPLTRDSYEDVICID